jgi:hypothetical protein
MESNDHPYRGYLEHATHFNQLPEGGSIRPADAIDLAARICRIEEMEGRPAALQDLMPFDRELCQRFAVWTDAPEVWSACCDAP